MPLPSREELMERLFSLIPEDGYSKLITMLAAYVSVEDLDEITRNQGYEDETEEKDKECERCCSDLDDNGRCEDLTCPFSDHDQDCPAGWNGHPLHIGYTCIGCQKYEREEEFESTEEGDSKEPETDAPIPEETRDYIQERGGGWAREV